MHGLADQSTGVEASGQRLRDHWVHLNKLGSPQGPNEAHKVGRSGSDEEALESAVEGY